MSTPCERLGYEEGMQFTLVNDDVDGLSAGDTLWLHSDDGSSNPEFRDTEKVNDDTETYYIDLPYVARYTPNKTLAYNRGLREGDILQMVMDDDGEEAYEGDIITFIKDDGDTCPQFEVQKDGNKAYLYLSHVGGLEPKVGRKVRVIHNCTGGFSSGTEGTIVDICSDGDYQIEAYGDTMYHHSSSCVVYGYAEDESSEKGSEPVKEDYPTKPASEWKEGDKGIVRRQQKDDPHNFAIGSEVTFLNPAGIKRGCFESPSFSRTQNVEYEMIEPISFEPYQVTISKVSKENPVACIKAIRTATGFGLYEAKQAYDFVRDNEEPYSLQIIISKGELTHLFTEAGIEYFFDRQTEVSGTKPTVIICDELADTSKKYKYFIDGDSIEVTLVGYFDGEPICAYKDRWGDTQLFVAKPSLLVEE
ncbi:hypothetical protein PJM40_0087 [Salmonella phage vB_SenP_UTK0002]|nr:hypothetical protein PJM40_0087 [Salmonella phage vB_SenP_UTK0002]